MNKSAKTRGLTPFKPGQSGNPGGRPKGLGTKAREYGGKCIEVLADALDSGDVKTRIAAARELLDRGYGKPLTMTAEVSNRLDELDDDTLNAAIGILRETVKAH